MAPVPLVSCHHGDIKDQNNLVSAARVLDKYDEIDILEIDFVFYMNDMISSHDYSAKNILHGSSLSKWIEMTVIHYGRVLWIDLKPRLDIASFLWSNDQKEEAICLFRILGEMKKKYGIKISESILITSQDPIITEEIEIANSLNEWRVVADIPHMSSYIWQAILPPGLQEWNDSSIYTDFTTLYDFSRFAVIAIDKSFFNNSIDRVFRFIKESNIKVGSTIIIYNFTKETPVIHSPNYNIVMQYDFSLLK